MTLPPSEQRHQYFRGLMDLMAERLSSRMLMEHRDAHGQSMFASRAWRLIACSIDGRSQAPEKVTVTDLFYLRGMDVGSVNVPYLLARYLRLFSSGRKQGAMIFGEIDDTWAWVAPGPERQLDAAAGAPEAAEDAFVADEGALTITAPVQAPQPPPPAARPA
nr:hypothetical protein [Tanacetum cinerariifolium]GEW67136.1 hypothetical protein [Tanacetum cinerariifolium]